MIGARYGGGGCYATLDLKMSSTFLLETTPAAISSTPLSSPHNCSLLPLPLNCPKMHHCQYLLSLPFVNWILWELGEMHYHLLLPVQQQEVLQELQE